MKSDKKLKGTGWDLLSYWSSGEYQVVTERLDDYDKKLVQYNPTRDRLFAGLELVPFGSVRVVIMGQDPYPQRVHCTGVAFSVPSALEGPLPPSLINIFKELEDDLHYPAPKNGDLSKWCEQGVLLWNVYPTCASGKPGSHHWVEWEPLTQEIVEKLDARGNVVFVLLGGRARNFSSLITHCPVVSTSHPSPLGVKHGFSGSRIFSRTNDLLCSLGQKPINWKLGEDSGKPQRGDH